MLLRVDVFTEPVLPSTLDPAIDQAGTGVAADIAVAIAAVVAGSGALAPVAPVDGSGAETRGVTDYPTFRTACIPAAAWPATSQMRV